MGITERRLRQKEEIKANILSTAWQIVKEDGWEAISIRKIADAIEYSVPVIYDHFENKEAILWEFARNGFQRLSKKIQQAKDTSDDPEQQLKAIANAYWSFAFKNREYYQLMFGLGMAGCEIEKCFPERAGFRKLVIEPITAIIAKGNNPDANPCLKYYTYWSILHGLISIKNMRNPNASDEINKLVMDDAIAGFVKNLG